MSRKEVTETPELSLREQARKFRPTFSEAELDHIEAIWNCRMERHKNSLATRQIREARKLEKTAKEAARQRQVLHRRQQTERLIASTVAAVTLSLKQRNTQLETRITELEASLA